jgi:class 3 adenylate cyclase
VSAETAVPDLAAAAREALRRHAWQEAYDLFTRAETAGTLTGRDLEDLAEAAWFAGQADASVQAKERAFQAYLAAGDRDRAAFLTFDLFEQYSHTGKTAIASAWMRRGERLVAELPEGAAHGWYELAKSDEAKAAGDVDAAAQRAGRAVDIGTRTGDADLRAIALTSLGALRIATGAASEGLADMEDAATSAVSGELSPFVTGVTYCVVIAACRDLTDYRRASEWTEAAERWCHNNTMSGFPGICRVHRAEVVALSGAWERAEQELRKATAELGAYNAIPPMADGFYAIGDIRRRTGDLEGAEEALRQAHALGRSPQPALALIRLAQGKVRAASQAIEGAIADETWDRWARARLLPARVEIAVAAGDAATARRAAEELGEHVTTYASPALEGSRHEAWGRVLLSEGDAAGAARELRSAIKRWQDVGAPYETASARVLLASALRRLGDDDAADLEFRAARDAFARLGARLDLASAERAMAEAAARRSAPAHARKTFMFTDIEGSTTLAETLGDQAWQQLLQWHDDALRSSFARFGGEVVNPTGDGFFVAFDDARRSVECAVDIQQALAEHRRTHGFAPAVRIGLHAAEATRRGDDYAGKGVHVAARVAALAAGGEIVATSETLEEAGPFDAGEAYQATLKGVGAPVHVAKVRWEA